MPFVSVHIARGTSPEKRRKLVLAIAEAVTDVLELDRAATQVLIHEHNRENWGIGGELLSERQGSIKAQLPDIEALFKKKPQSEPVPKISSTVSAQKRAAKPRSRQQGRRPK